MAEVFATASAAVGVAAAAGQLIDGIAKLSAFCSQIRYIPDDIQNAVEDLSTMVEILDFVQAEIGQECQPPLNFGPSMKVLASLQQSSRQVGEVLQEMQMKIGTKKYWSRIKAVGMKRKLEKTTLRVQSVQSMLLVALATDNRYISQCPLCQLN